jgi:DHA2 family methylenomycin A resistance protein-like MFS transporter
VRVAPLVLVATSVAGFTATLDNTIVAVALRDIQRELGSGVTGLQGIVTAYTVALAALLLAGGALVDRLGAKQVFLSGLAGFGLASIGCALSHSVTELVACRAVQGTGAALLLPGSLALLAGAYPVARDRRRAIALWAALAGVALVAGPVVGGELVADHGWTWVFWLNVPLCVLAAVLALPAARPVTAVGARLDGRGIALTCLGLGGMTVAIVLAGHGSRLLVAVLLLATAGALGLLLRVERSADDPLLPAGLMRSRQLRGATLGAFAASVGLFLVLVFLALFVQLIQDLDARAAGRLLLALPVALVVVAVATSRWHAVAVPVGFGLALAGVGLVVTGARLTADTSVTELRVLLAVIGAGIGLTTAPLVTAALSAGRGREGLASATVSMARELGGVLAIGGLGSIAVARLAARLDQVLASGGVSGPHRPALVDALLGARTSEVRSLLLRDIGIERSLALNSRLSDVAQASFTASTSLVLVLAGAFLVLAGAVTAWLLRAES